MQNEYVKSIITLNPGFYAWSLSFNCWSTCLGLVWGYHPAVLIPEQNRSRPHPYADLAKTYANAFSTEDEFNGFGY